MSSSGTNDLENSRIPLEEIIRATNNFSIETKRGEGGFGVVYRGQLSESWNNRLVAIKRLHPNSYQGNEEFDNELKMYSIFNHPNIIPFIGYYNDANEKILVYEYASKGSLDHHLQDQNKRRCLTWEQRLKICLGAAKGIKYLHSGVGEYTRVIHRDLKPANILLDDNLEAKICDFGLSKFAPRNQTDTHVRTKAAGTICYMDPVYHERRMLSKESDIYSFGVVMFEMSSGMMAYNPRRFGDAGREKYLIDLVRSHYDDHELVGGINELIDTATQIETSSFHKFNEIAHECISMNLNKRPTIDKIIQRIEEALNILLNLQVDPQCNLHQSGRTTYMLGGKDLSIEWQNDTRYWELEHKPNSRFPEVWILKKVYCLEIQGRIAAVMLSPNITYVAYLVFRTAEDSKGLSLPAETRVRCGGKKRRTHNVYLQRPRRVQEDYVVPRHREDGWMEVKLGEFKCDEGDDGEVKIKLKEDNYENRKTGLIVAGIEIRSI